MISVLGFRFFYNRRVVASVGVVPNLQVKSYTSQRPSSLVLRTRNQNYVIAVVLRESLWK